MVKALGDKGLRIYPVERCRPFDPKIPLSNNAIHLSMRIETILS